MNNLKNIFNTTGSPLAIAVTSGKGGVGKTSVSVNLAAALRKLKRSVMLLDADLGLANVDVLLGLKPRYNLTHVIKGECALDDVIIEGPERMLIVPAGSGIHEMADLGALEQAGLINAFNELRSQIDILIIDTAAGINRGVLNFCQAAGEVLVVLSNEPASLTDSYGLIKVLASRHGVKRFHVVTNRDENSADGFLLYQRLVDATDRFLNIEINYLGSIPQDKYMHQSHRRQRLLSQAYPQCPAVHAFDELARRVSRWRAPTAPRGGMEFFFERLVSQTTAA